MIATSQNQVSERTDILAHFWAPRKSIFSNIFDDFMASSIKTIAKDTLGPIFGDNSKVTSCMKLQKTDISENCSEALHCKKLSPESTIVSIWDSNHAEIFAQQSKWRVRFGATGFRRHKKSLSTSGSVKEKRRTCLPSVTTPDRHIATCRRTQASLQRREVIMQDKRCAGHKTVVAHCLLLLPLRVVYRDRLKGGPAVWWILFLLFLTTSAWLACSIHATWAHL